MNKISNSILLIITIITFSSCEKISKDAEEIVKVAETVCDCEAIESTTIVGVAISAKRDSSVGDRHDITLKNCKGLANKQTVLIQEALIKNTSLCDGKYIVLSFVNETSNVRTYIDNCKAILKY